MLSRSNDVRRVARPPATPSPRHRDSASVWVGQNASDTCASSSTKSKRGSEGAKRRQRVAAVACDMVSREPCLTSVGEDSRAFNDNQVQSEQVQVQYGTDYTVPMVHTVQCTLSLLPNPNRLVDCFITCYTVYGSYLCLCGRTLQAFVQRGDNAGRARVFAE